MKHKKFAKTLATWREDNGYTQQEAADKLGVSRRSLENWEQKRAMPQGFGLGAILRVIGGKDRAPAVRKAVRRRQSPPRKSPALESSASRPALDTHLL